MLMTYHFGWTFCIFSNSPHSSAPSAQWLTPAKKRVTNISVLTESCYSRHAHIGLLLCQSYLLLVVIERFQRSEKWRTSFTEVHPQIMIQTLLELLSWTDPKKNRQENDNDGGSFGTNTSLQFTTYYIPLFYENCRIITNVILRVGVAWEPVRIGESGMAHVPVRYSKRYWGLSVRFSEDVAAWQHGGASG